MTTEAMRQQLLAAEARIGCQPGALFDLHPSMELVASAVQPVASLLEASQRLCLLLAQRAEAAKSVALDAEVEWREASTRHAELVAAEAAATAAEE